MLVPNTATAKVGFFFLCFCVSGFTFPLNLTVGGWSITGKIFDNRKLLIRGEPAPAGSWQKPQNTF